MGTQLLANFIIAIDIFSIQYGDTALHIAAAMGRYYLLGRYHHHQHHHNNNLIIII